MVRLTTAVPLGAAVGADDRLGEGEPLTDALPADADPGHHELEA